MEESRNTEFENITRVVGAVILSRKADKVLVGQRAYDAKHPGKWEFIGGKVEAGEDLDQAIVREVAEETHLRIEPGKLLDIAVYDYGGDIGRVQVNFIQCSLKSGVARLNREAYQKIEWIQATKLPELDWIEADKWFANSLAVRLTSPIPSQN